EEHGALEVRKLGQHLECGSADVTVVLRPLIPPRAVTHTEQRHRQADERKGTGADLIPHRRPTHLDPGPLAHRRLLSVCTTGPAGLDLYYRLWRYPRAPQHLSFAPHQPPTLRRHGRG